MRSDYGADEAIRRWMDGQGDALLRTCYLLCGDLRTAHRVARLAFARAWAKRNPSSFWDKRAMLCALLREAMRLCPCRKAPSSPPPGGFIARLSALPPEPRRIALLCLYHGLSIREAARILEREEADVLLELRFARQQLEK